MKYTIQCEINEVVYSYKYYIYVAWSNLGGLNKGMSAKNCRVKCLHHNISHLLTKMAILKAEIIDMYCFWSVVCRYQVWLAYAQEHKALQIRHSSHIIVLNVLLCEFVHTQIDTRSIKFHVRYEVDVVQDDN